MIRLRVLLLRLRSAGCLGLSCCSFLLWAAAWLAGACLLATRQPQRLLGLLLHPERSALLLLSLKLLCKVLALRLLRHLMSSAVMRRAYGFVRSVTSFTTVGMLGASAALSGCRVGVGVSSFVTAPTRVLYPSEDLPAWRGDWTLAELSAALHARHPEFLVNSLPRVVHLSPAVETSLQLRQQLLSQGVDLTAYGLVPDDAADDTDGADSLGRVAAAVDRSERQFAAVDLRFLAGTVSPGGVGSVGATLGEWSFIVPLGEGYDYSTTSTRHQQTAVASSQSNLVSTQDQAFSSGTSIHVLAGWLAGRRYRLRGTLSTTQFVGATGVDTAGTSYVIDADVPAGSWVRLGWDVSANAGIAWSPAGLTGNGSASGVTVEVRVRP